MKMKIGYIRNRYPEIRNIINRGGDECTYRQIGKLRSFFLMLTRGFEITAGRLLRRNFRMNNDPHAVYHPFLSPKVDVIHTFNTVCNTKTPWISTFETCIPRTNCVDGRAWEYGKVKPDKITLRGYELITKDSCAAIIAISEANRNIQIRMMQALDIPNQDAIQKKIRVITPPQPVLITQEELDKKFDSIADCVEFIMVGGLFFRKGGKQIVDALAEYAAAGKRLHLTVVSSLTLDNLSGATAEDKKKYEEILTHSDWINYYPSLPNAQVLELCKKAHIGLLPTMADTYGYAVLEMQSCGCAVITTDVRAMPEMNNDDCGYLIHVPKQPSTEAKYDTPEELKTLKQIIFSEIHRITGDILQNPWSVKTKAQEAVAKIQRDHSPEEYARQISSLYANAVRMKS